MARFNNKKPTEYVYSDTVVWQCTACNCWSRVEFIHEAEPQCPMCNSAMEMMTKNIRVE